MVVAERACRHVTARYHVGMTSKPQRLQGPDAPRGGTPLAVETKLFQGLADPARLRILLALRARPVAPGELAAELGLTPSNTSNHLLCLLECGLLSVESVGRYNVYRLADPAVDRLLDAGAALIDVVGSAIEACLKYGPPSRRALRRSAGVRKPDDRLGAKSSRPVVGRKRARRITSPNP